MVRFSDFIKKQGDAKKEKEVSKKEESSGKLPSSIRISEKVKESAAQKSKEKREISKARLTESIKEGEKKKEKTYKEIEVKIGAFRLAQIVREREKTVENPRELYEEVLKKVLSFWEKLEKKESIDFNSLKTEVSSLVGSLKNTAAILANLTKSYPPENYLPYHSLNVSLISIVLGLSLNWSGERLQDLGFASLLHDVGMSQIPKEIYLKSGPLRSNERGKIEEHPKRSFEMLKKAGALNENIDSIVFQHHEHSSGRGYPQGLSGKEIHPGAKIVALADVFEAMTHPRLYQKARFPYDVLTKLIDEKAGNFDKTILKALIQELTFYPLGTFVRLNSGEIAIVERTTKDYPTRPNVRVLLSEGGEKLELPREVNLSRERLLYIQRPLSTPVEQRKAR